MVAGTDSTMLPPWMQWPAAPFTAGKDAAVISAMTARMACMVIMLIVKSVECRGGVSWSGGVECRGVS